MTISQELQSLAEEFRIYAKAECAPEGARWTQWADACDAAAKDAARVDHLEELIRNCPHAEFFFSDDGADEKPLGFSIEVDGCEPMSHAAPTFRAAVDASMKP